MLVKLGGLADAAEGYKKYLDLEPQDDAIKKVYEEVLTMVLYIILSRLLGHETHLLFDSRPIRQNFAHRL